MRGKKKRKLNIDELKELVQSIQEFEDEMRTNSINNFGTRLFFGCNHVKVHFKDLFDDDESYKEIVQKIEQFLHEKKQVLIKSIEYLNQKTEKNET